VIRSCLFYIRFMAIAFSTCGCQVTLHLLGFKYAVRLVIVWLTFRRIPIQSQSYNEGYRHFKRRSLGSKYNVLLAVVWSTFQRDVSKQASFLLHLIQKIYKIKTITLQSTSQYLGTKDTKSLHKQALNNKLL